MSNQDIQFNKRYAKALFDVAIEQDQAESIYQELQTLRQVYQEVPEYGNFITNAPIDNSVKSELFNNLVEHFDGSIKNFLKILNDCQHLENIPGIVDQYEHLYHEQLGIFEAKITSAVELTPEQKEKLTQSLLRIFNYDKVNVTAVVEPKIMGGVIVEANHQVIDGSVLRKLANLRQQINR